MVVLWERFHRESALRTKPIAMESLPQAGRLRLQHLQRQRRFLDRHVNQRRADGEDDVYDPHGVEASSHGEHREAQSGTEEAADSTRHQRGAHAMV